MIRTSASTSIALFTCGSLFALAAAATAEEVTFDPTYQVGKRYHYEQTINSAVKMALGELKMDQESAMVMNLSLGVTAGDSGNKLVTAKTERLRADMNMLGQAMSYDSDKPEASNSLISGIFSAAMGGETTLVFSEDDEFVEVKSAPDDAAPKKGGLGGMMGGADMAGGQIQQFATDLVRNDFPEGPVAPGTSWETKQSMDVPQIGDLTTALDNTYVGMEKPEGAAKELARVDFQGTMGAGAGEAKSGSTSVGFKGGDIKGSYYYDPDDRVMRRLDVEMEITMTMNNGETTMELPTKQKSSALLTELEDQ
ncbi:hypothetical protein BH23VER1_BH23VER1_37470 [soil metagenome]